MPVSSPCNPAESLRGYQIADKPPDPQASGPPQHIEQVATNQKLVALCHHLNLQPPPSVRPLGLKSPRWAPFLLFKLALCIPKGSAPGLGAPGVTLSKVGLSYPSWCHSTSLQKDPLCHHPPPLPPTMLRSIVIIMVIIVVAISLSPSQILMAAVPHKSFRLMSHKDMLPRSLPLQWPPPPPPPRWPLSLGVFGARLLPRSPGAGDL